MNTLLAMLAVVLIVALAVAGWAIVRLVGRLRDVEPDLRRLRKECDEARATARAADAAAIAELEPVTATFPAEPWLPVDTWATSGRHSHSRYQPDPAALYAHPFRLPLAIAEDEEPEVLVGAVDIDQPTGTMSRGARRMLDKPIPADEPLIRAIQSPTGTYYAPGTEGRGSLRLADPHATIAGLRVDAEPEKEPPALFDAYKTPAVEDALTAKSGAWPELVRRDDEGEPEGEEPLVLRIPALPQRRQAVNTGRSRSKRKGGRR